MIDKKGCIILVFGSSGAGKSTLMSLLKNEENFYIPTYSTTRQARKDEVDGQDYNFVNINDFCHEDYKYTYSCHGNIYGIPYEIEEKYKAGKKVVMGVSRKLIKQIKQDFQNVLVVFIDISKDLIKQRIVTRDPKVKEEEIEIREEKSLELIDWGRSSHEVDYIIDNSSNISELREKFLNFFKEGDY